MISKTQEEMFNKYDKLATKCESEGKLDEAIAHRMYLKLYLSYAVNLDKQSREYMLYKMNIRQLSSCLEDRGLILLTLGRYDDAINDFNHSIMEHERMFVRSYLYQTIEIRMKQLKILLEYHKKNPKPQFTPPPKEKTNEKFS